jgi:SAM-dependent methyltransferase
VNCVSCGAPVEMLIEKGILPGKSPVYRCGGCGLDFLDHAANDEYWETPGQDAIYEDEAVAAERVRFFESILERAAAFAGKGTLLDVGAGKGEFACLAAVAGWQVSVVEPSAKATEGLPAKGITVFNRLIEDVESAETYDCVTLLDLLEHTRDPRETIRKVASFVKPGGVLVILTPDGGSLVRRGALAAARLSRNLSGLLKYQYYMPHLSYANESWMRAAARECGLSVARIERPATPRRFMAAKLALHYRKYPGNALIVAAANCAYPLASRILGNKLLVFLRKEPT